LKPLYVKQKLSQESRNKDTPPPVWVAKFIMLTYQTKTGSGKECTHTPPTVCVAAAPPLRAFSHYHPSSPVFWLPFHLQAICILSSSPITFAYFPVNDSLLILTYLLLNFLVTFLCTFQFISCKSLLSLLSKMSHCLGRLRCKIKSQDISSNESFHFVLLKETDYNIYYKHLLS
jgi:hypothetical protein